MDEKRRLRNPFQLFDCSLSSRVNFSATGLFRIFQQLNQGPACKNPDVVVDVVVIQNIEHLEDQIIGRSPDAPSALQHFFTKSPIRFIAQYTYQAWLAPG